MQIFNNFDLLTVTVAVAGTTLLGFIVLYSDRTNNTNRFFFLLSIITAIWGTLNYLSYNVADTTMTLWLFRFVLFTAVWQVVALFAFISTFPNQKYNFVLKSFSSLFLFLAVPVSLFTLSPYVFPALEQNAGENIPKAVESYGLIVFGVFNISLVFIGLQRLFLKRKDATKSVRNLINLFFIGLLITFSLIIIFNFLYPIVLQTRDYIPYGAVFTFPMIVFAAYGALKLKALRAKAVATGFFVFFILILLVIDFIFTDKANVFLISLNVFKFIFILILGILLLKSAVDEVKQREQIEVLASNLKKANERLRELDRLKSQFVSIASHQLRSPLTAIKGYSSLILEGSFGAVHDSVKEAVQKIFDSSALMAVSVQDFLDVSRIEQGKMKYHMEPFDMEKLVTTVTEEFYRTAKEKGLDLSLRIDEGESFKTNGDLGKIKQVLTNLIDNSIKYTPKGSISVIMCKMDGKINVEIRDTGVGISKEILPKLFQKFVRSQNAHHVNVSGTGLGLFVVREMVKAHKGRVWATSEGEGKGSTFHLELKEYLTIS